MIQIASLPETSQQRIAELYFGAEEVAPLCSVSVRTWRTWDAAGSIPRPIHLGRTKLWNKAEFFAWCAAGFPSRDEWEKSPEIDRKHGLRRGHR